MSSEAVTRNDLKAILDEVLPSSTDFVLKDEQSKLAESNTGTISLYGCTGTISHNQIYFTKLQSGLWFVQGRVNINSFVRTASNPGVVITMPAIVPTPTKSNTFIVGFRGQSPRESVNLTLSNGSRDATFITTESFANAANGTLTFIVNGIITLD